jgi:hypothetical protein
MEWKDLARACRALAHTLEQSAERQKGTSVYPAAVEEVKRFREYTERCEREARSASR